MSTHTAVATGESLARMRAQRPLVQQITNFVAGPVWATPSKTDAAAPIGLHGLSAICAAAPATRASLAAAP